jgi:uncharacterized metal-binding protein YceD (DUF177 family)
MHVNVRDILFQEVGFSQAFTISGERPKFQDVKLTEDLEGEFRIDRLDDSLMVRGNASSALELECHRCLRTFTHPMRIRFQQIFKELPADDELPIETGVIDLAPMLEQEFLLALPIKILHAPDCPGIRTDSDGGAASGKRSVRNIARITKRNP